MLSHKEELEIISKIADRALLLASVTDASFAGLEKFDWFMAIDECHSKGCPLRLQELLDAENFDFRHDVFGIMHKLNKQTGKLEDCFSPRYSKSDAVIKEEISDSVSAMFSPNNHAH